MTRPALATLLYRVAPDAAFCAALERLAGRAVEIVVADGRDAAVRAARAEYCVFVDPADALDSSFLEQACRLLDRDPALVFVTSWVDGVPLHHDSVARAIDAAALLARPWFAHVPTVFRRAAWERAGGFDESLAAAADVDLLVRVLADGGAALGLAEARLRDRAWGPPFDWETEGAAAVARRFCDKHRALIEAHWEAVLLGKERITRELYAVRAPLEDRTRDLVRELDGLAHDLAAARARLTR
jgi:hypothetical protein